MAISISRLATALARRIQHQGLVCRSHTSPSKSTYLWVELPEERQPDLDYDQLAAAGWFRTVEIRVSDHQNPAYRWDRVAGLNDRATVVDAEFRVDLGVPEWRARVDALIAPLVGLLRRPVGGAPR